MAFRLMLCCGKGFDWKGSRENKEGWRVFSLKELLGATNNFNYDNILGEGSFGSVYWGQLWDGSELAVKRLKILSDKAEMEFSAEIEVLARARHKNLLNLRGYCAEGQERLIVYDFMPNSSLHSHLHGRNSIESVPGWRQRVNIAVGSAEGIVYLHYHAIPRIIHRDIKASNILLDSSFQARVADFGFAKIIPYSTTDAIKEKGSAVGYMAPEYAILGRASESCDVYSFGIVLLELVSGRRPLQKLNPGTNHSITDWAFPLAREGNFKEIADLKLGGDFDEEELRKLVLVALMSAQKQPEKRPTMQEVVELLKGEAQDKLTKLESSLFRNSQSADNKDENAGDREI